MTARAAAARLPGGRLHLHHGPIDLIVSIEGPGRANAEAAATRRFATILDELVDELPRLRAPVAETGAQSGPFSGPLSGSFSGTVARRMADAARRCLPAFVTPMAAVAGSVADEIADVIANAGGVDKAAVNNGGDVALVLTGDETATAAIAGGPGALRLSASDPWRGVATSGWRGRSHSLGVADAVTIIARNAATADVAATLIANAVDLPGHAAVTRTPARDLSPDSDLGDRLVTTAVGPLSPAETAEALDRGAAEARRLMARVGDIGAAALFLNGESRRETLQTKEIAHA